MAGTEDRALTYADTCTAQERAWQPVIDALDDLGVQASVVQTGGMVFCIIAPLDGTEVAWGVANGDTWEGGDDGGERVFHSDVPVSRMPFSPVAGEEAVRLAHYIADSVYEMKTGFYL